MKQITIRTAETEIITANRSSAGNFIYDILDAMYQERHQRKQHMKIIDADRGCIALVYITDKSVPYCESANMISVNENLYPLPDAIDVLINMI